MRRIAPLNLLAFTTGFALLYLILSGCGFMALAMFETTLPERMITWARVLFYCIIELLTSDAIGLDERTWFVPMYIANALFYGFLAALTVEWIVPERPPKGLCRHCGYDLRGTLAAGCKRCPECGRDVPEP